MAEISLHEDLKRRPEVRGSSDRSFGIVFAVFFAVVGLSPLRHHRPVRGWWLAMAVPILVTALLRPVWLRQMNRAWTMLGLFLGRIVNPVVMGLLFFLVITPMSLLFRLLGKDPLRLATDAAAHTYWIERRPPGPPPETMRNQF